MESHTKNSLFVSRTVYIAFGVLFYILLASIQSLLHNPIVRGASITISIIVPVLAGMLLGPRSGATVGFFGTVIAVLVSSTFPFEIVAILPHTVIGYLAGRWTTNISPTIGGFALITGHMLNNIGFVITDLLPIEILTMPSFYFGLGIEIIGELFCVYILYLIYTEMFTNIGTPRYRW